MNECISLICSRSPKERIPLLLNFLYEYGILQNKKVYLQSFDLSSYYYINRLVSLISKIEFRLVESYMFPIETKTLSLKKEKMDYNEFMSALEKIRNSHIVISSNKVFNEDWLDYIFDKTIEPYDVIIINDFDKLLKKSHKDIKTIKKTIEQYSEKYNTYVILFAKDSVLINKFLDWKIAKVNDPLEFVFDDKNYNLIDIS